MLNFEFLKWNREEKEAMPFFIIVAVVMTFLYGLTVYSRPDLRAMPAVVVFSILMAVHSVLHWFYSIFARKRRNRIIYFAVQTALAVFVVLYTGEMTLVFGLFLPLLGEEVGIAANKKSIFFAVLLNVLLISGSIYLIFRETEFELFMFAGIVPLVFFVIIYVYLYTRQNEAKTRAEDLLLELEAANKKLAEKNLQIEDLTKEQERQRIARELHDTLAQGLSGLILQLEAASAHMSDKNTEKAEEIIGRAMKKARETLSGARDVIDGLRSGINEANLIDYLENSKKIFPARYGIRLLLSIEGKPELTLPEEENLIKIVSEALNNTAVHSGAKEAEVRISTSGRNLEMVIRDDGKGFDTSGQQAGHYGLLGIRERCVIIGASVDIASGPDGTKIIISLSGDGNE